MSERRYQMVRISAGDYLLPSNDAQTLWRIYSFVDGKSGGLNEPDRTWWALAKYPGSLERAQSAVERDIENYGYLTHDHWQEVNTYLETCKAAIEAALNYDVRKVAAT